MITKKTKVQLMVFVLITMVGVSYVGARYARLDRLIFDDSYRVVAHFAESGGIFEGAEVSYRGVTVGRVGDMVLTSKGVDVVLEVDDDSEPIPRDTRALVGNRSAVGEQYVELQPASDGAPYLDDGSEIATERTATPIPTTKLLVDLNKMVNSVHKDSLRTVVSEMGKAFNGTGENLGQIIDTSNSFIETADRNFDVTSALIRDSNTVLQTQIDSTSSIKGFSRDLALLSDTLVSSDADLRRVIANGSATANQLRTFLEQNGVNLGQLLNNLVTTGEIVVEHLDGIEQILVLYPYVVEGGYTVVDKDPDTGLYDAHFGMVLTQDPPVCHHGYESTDTREPQDTEDRPMNEQAHCAEPQAQSNARGAQWAPRAGAAYRAPVVGAYDSSTGHFSYTDKSPSGSVTYTGGAASVFGEESWKWLLLQPLGAPGENNR
ncbi:MAG TPA: MlaD family protein [Nocardioidaceae bacterium]|nr:MlaD family protein [Nocardioidaceae bacterium]